MEVIVALLCVFAQFVYALDTTPLLLIDFNSVVYPSAPEGAPFAVTSPDIIRHMLQDATRSKMVLFFIEESLCAEDLSLKDEHGTPFSFLRDHISRKLVKYYPRVLQPVKLMKEVFPPHTQIRVTEMDATVMRVLDTRPEYLYIRYRDGMNEPRAAALRRHDAVIKQMYFAARRIMSGPVVGVWVTRYSEIPLEVPLEVTLENGTKIMKKTEVIGKVRPLVRGWSCRKCRKGSVNPSETEITTDFIYAYVHKYRRGSKRWNCWTLIFAIRRTATHWFLEYVTVFHRDQEATHRPKVGHTRHFEEPVKWGHSFIYNRRLDFQASEVMKVTLARLQIEPIIENVGKEENERRHYFIEDKEHEHKKDVNKESVSNLNVTDYDHKNDKGQSGEGVSNDTEEDYKDQSGESVSHLNVSKYGHKNDKGQSEEYVEYEDEDLDHGPMGGGYPHEDYGPMGEGYPHGDNTLGTAPLPPADKPKQKPESKPDVEGSEVFITPGILSGLILSFILMVPLLMSIHMFLSLGNNNHNMRFDQRPLLRPEEVAG